MVEVLSRLPARKPCSRDLIEVISWTHLTLYDRCMARRENPLSAPVDADGRLSAQMRQMRHTAGFSLTEAAERAGWSTNHLSQVENGKQAPSELLIIDLDALFGADGLLLSLYEEVLSERRHRALVSAVEARAREVPLMREAVGDDRWLPEPGTVLPLTGDHAEWWGDITIPAGTILERGSLFTKTWRLRNAGDVEWRDRFLKRIGPTAASTLAHSPRAVQLPVTLPGEIVEVTVACRAQWIPSTSVAHFKMSFADGRLCWPDRYSHGVDLLVTAIEGPSCECMSCRVKDPQAAHAAHASREERQEWMAARTMARVVRSN